ncbi:hypothetical protein FPOAC2_08694 [Fusarium poae]|uniref:hypothetical protein n=1 Tax=Fusarium poae TaxID=36050 RepID=UPI001CE9B3B9|nr:hypothetical protein FPOAC1_008761 [Fusarium poae]KAG8669367.1 hypothetical protein FPOAC1_008761 [Fusarium poae]
MATITAEDRIERFRSWLETKATPQKTAGLKPGSNLLLASALHGIARRGKGHELTDLENLAVRPFIIMTESEEEIVALGQICSEAKAAARSRNFAAFNAPNGIMSMPDDAPLTREQFNDQVRELGEETVLQPHIRAVSSEQVQPDGTIEPTETFVTASSALGRGVTMFIDPPPEKVDVTDTGYVRVWLKPEIFKCYKKSGELGKDEIYFSWGWGDDQNHGISHKTPEFGSVVTGTIRNFPSNTPDLHQGNVSQAVCGTIICWEADQSSSDWYDKLIQAMRELSSLAKSLTHDVGNDALNALIVQLPGFSQYAEMAFWIENVAMIIGAFLDWFRNHDDKVAEHNYGFNRQFLRNYQHPDAFIDFSFDGGSGGKFSLFARALIGPDMG